MSTLARKEKEKQQRHKQIEDAAQALFFSKNYDEITIEEIAKKSQLAKGTIYLYFKSKEELYSAVALRGAHIMNTMFKKAADRKRTGLEKASAIGQAYYEFYKLHPQYFRMLMAVENFPCPTAEDVNGAELMKTSCENLETVLNAVVKGIEDGSINPELDPKLTSIFLIQSTRAMILLPPGFETFLGGKAGQELPVKFTLKSLARSLQNRPTEKMED